MSDTIGTMVRIEREFGHPSAKVFQAFLNPAIIQQWYGPRNSTVGDMVVEAHVGGRFDVELLSERFGKLWVRGHFKEITPFSKLVYSFIFDPDLFTAGDSEVTVNLTEQNGMTKVSVVQALAKVIDPQGRTNGWREMFDKLEALLSA